MLCLLLPNCVLCLLPPNCVLKRCYDGEFYVMCTCFTIQKENIHSQLIGCTKPGGEPDLAPELSLSDSWATPSRLAPPRREVHPSGSWGCNPTHRVPVRPWARPVPSPTLSFPTCKREGSPVHKVAMDTGGQCQGTKGWLCTQREPKGSAQGPTAGG